MSINNLDVNFGNIVIKYILITFLPQVYSGN